MASASVSKPNTGASGPKVSWEATSIVASQPSRTVGSKKYPLPLRRLPPTRTTAPLAMASAACASTLARAASLIRGPCVTPSAVPSPILSAPTDSANFWTNSSRMPLWTKRRLVHTHVWPALRNLAATAPATAASTSQSSKTRKGALPPSSSESRFTVDAHWRISSFPTAVEPVNESLRTSLELHSTSPIAAAFLADEGMTESTPGGTPARCASSHRARAEYGVRSEGLTTIVQPAPSAGAALRVIIAEGKFQGVMAAVTPIGCLSVIMRRPGVGESRVCPLTRLASSPNHSQKDAA
mmetsp:Transcript_13980/g.42641  ORF Transcript_13980/g.42641 Transcript_13980/m.42641 type:complete len:297 (-) Transcript_13980:623-1513(-)